MGRKIARAARDGSRRAAAILLALALGGCIARPPPPPPEAPAPPAASPAPPPPCERIDRVLVRKSERALVAECAGGGRLAFKVALSREPGPKRSRGDRRTPEGHYRIAAAARPSRFHRFIPIDYPSLADADRALDEGRLTAAERARIADAHARGVQPPADTALGGDIGIHGEGARWQGDSEHLDWTYGCIAVTDEQLEFLAERVAPGVPIEIHP
jgi:murein L,D-transpeptidase YafK